MKAVLMSGSFKKLEIYDEIISFINQKSISRSKIVFIASSFDEYESNDHFANKLIKCFEEKNMYFDTKIIIDSRMDRDMMIKSIRNSNIIFLLGGDTLKQIESINKYNLKKSINSKNKIIMGISSGAINMASRVVLAKDEDDNIPELSIYDGVGITKINIEPHCDFNDKAHWSDLEDASMYPDIIVMHDNAFIIIDGEHISYFGSYLTLRNREVIYNDEKSSLEKFLKDIKYD